MKIFLIVFILCQLFIDSKQKSISNNHSNSNHIKTQNGQAKNYYIRNYYEIQKFVHNSASKYLEIENDKSFYMDDIVLTENDLIEFQNSKNEKLDENNIFKRVKKAVTANMDKLWPDGVIPYEISDIYRGDQVITFIKAMRIWESATCVLFVERNESHTHWISILQQECGCCSMVGRNIQNGAQNVSLGVLCDTVGIAAHEFGHVIGFWHEHTRPDRDTYLIVEYQNIKPGQEINFYKKNSTEINSLNEPYDFLSIMHYSNNTFSINDVLPTLSIREKYKTETVKLMGQRNNLSRIDILQTNKLYRCNSCVKTFYEAEGKIELNPKEENKTCHWRIKGMFGYRIKIKIDEFKIRLVNKTCKHNYIAIYDGYSTKHKLIGRYCGHRLVNTEFMSTQPYLLINYVSSNSLERQTHRLKVSYKMICGGKFKNSIGTVNSPNFPEQYSTNTTCEWSLEMPSEYTIELTFVYFSLEQSNQCSYDSLQIFDGGIENPIKNYTYCGSPQHLGNIRSSSNKVTLRFYSDFLVTSNGFMIQYRQKLDICKTNSTGCQQRCVNGQESYRCECNEGYMLAGDRKSCIVDYSSKSSSSQEECGGIIDATVAANGFIRSPKEIKTENGIHNYPVDQDCKWIIKANRDYKIIINITHMDIEGDMGSCKYDYLNIYSLNEDNSIADDHGYFCDNVVINKLISSKTNKIGLNFKSDSSVTKTGFSLFFTTDKDECYYDNGGCSQLCINQISSYKCACHSGYVLKNDSFTCEENTDCNHVIAEPEGVISSPRFPKEYPHNQNCSWNISIKQGHRISFVFKFFEIEPSNNCVYDHILIDGEIAPSKETYRPLCGSELPPPKISETNNLKVKLITDSSGSRQGFQLQYTSVCGGDLIANKNEQIFYSHIKYGIEDYPKNENCTWNIKSSDSKKCIKLEFQDFQLEKPEENQSKKIECHYDGVEVFDSNAKNFKNSKLATLCGSDKPKPIVSSTSSIQINFFTDNEQEDKGFIGNYQTIEC